MGLQRIAGELTPRRRLGGSGCRAHLARCTSTARRAVTRLLRWNSGPGQRRTGGSKFVLEGLDLARQRGDVACAARHRLGRGRCLSSRSKPDGPVCSTRGSPPRFGSSGTSPGSPHHLLSSANRRPLAALTRLPRRAIVLKPRAPSTAKHPCRGTLRVRHQSECGWHQATAIRSAAAAGVPTSGIGSDDLKPKSGVCERAIGGVRSIGPVIYPSNGDVTQTKRHPENQGRFSGMRSGSSDRSTTTIRVRGRGGEATALASGFRRYLFASLAPDSSWAVSRRARTATPLAP